MLELAAGFQRDALAVTRQLDDGPSLPLAGGFVPAVEKATKDLFDPPRAGERHDAALSINTDLLLFDPEPPARGRLHASGEDRYELV
jgi:hypothetical protein